MPRARRRRRPRRTAPSIGPHGDKGDKGDTPNVRVTCDLSADGKSIVCTITAIPPSGLEVEGEVHGCSEDRRQLEGHAQVRQGQGHDDLRSSKRLKKAPKVIIKVTAGKKSASKTVTAK